MEKWNELEVKRVLKEIAAKAAQDTEFRKLCLNDPAAAIKEISGKEIPENMKVRFVENQGAHMTFVLPDPVSSDISEDELDMVVGGTCGSAGCTQVDCDK